MALLKKVYNMYFITISPPHRKGSDKYNYRNDKHWIRHICLRRCSKHFVIYPELSEDDRLHYHGIVRIDDYKKWYKQTKYKLTALGYISVKRIKDFKMHLDCLLYCMKNYSKTQLAFKRFMMIKN